MRYLSWLGGLGMSAGLLTACGSGPQCGSGNFVLQVAPAAATVDHLAAPPGNQVQFFGNGAPTAPPGCAVPAFVVREDATWTNPDAKNIQISSALDATNGLAVCKGVTAGAVTLTGAFARITEPPATVTTAKTVQLTCK